jgi:hypothetical protein
MPAKEKYSVFFNGLNDQRGSLIFPPRFAFKSYRFKPKHLINTEKRRERTEIGGLDDKMSA